MVINSGSAEHKTEHWLTNKECVHILHLWLLVLHFIIKQYSVDIFSWKKPKVFTKTLVILHSSISGTFMSQMTSTKKVVYSRSSLKYNTTVCKTFLLISWVWALNLVIYQKAITHTYSLTSKSITFTWNWNILRTSQYWNFFLYRLFRTVISSSFNSASLLQKKFQIFQHSNEIISLFLSQTTLRNFLSYKPKKLSVYTDLKFQKV